MNASNRPTSRTGSLPTLIGIVAVVVGLAGCDTAATPLASNSVASRAGPTPDAGATVVSTSSPSVTASPGSAGVTPAPTGDDSNCDIDLDGDGTHRITCGDLDYVVAVPSDCGPGACGLIVDVHGWSASANFADQHTAMRARGTAAGFIVVQPDNTTKDSWDASSDDDAIRAFLDSLIAELGIDRNRVHMGGFSQGGWMTWRFVCNHADLIASAAPIGAGASIDDEAGFGFSCDFEVGALPTAEVDVVYVHGTDDPDIPFETAVQQRDLMVEAWEMEGPEIVMETADLRWSRWASTTGTVLEFIEHDWVGGMLGGHCYPGSGATLGCGEDTDIHYADVAISFYLAHPKDE